MNQKITKSYLSRQYLDIAIFPGQYLDVALVAVYFPALSFDPPTQSVATSINVTYDEVFYQLSKLHSFKSEGQ